MPPVPPARTLHLHFKVLAEPNVARADMVAAMKLTYAAAGINVADPTVEDLTQLTALANLHIGTCTTEDEITPEEDQLFAYRNYAPADQICVYFVRSVLPPVYCGCGTRKAKLPGFENGRPSVVIGARATRWTLAHECGHVLGLVHAPGQDRLMYEQTSRITAQPPLLDAGEGNAMRTSRFLR